MCVEGFSIEAAVSLSLLSLFIKKKTLNSLLLKVVVNV